MGRHNRHRIAIAVLWTAAVSTAGQAADQLQWGEAYSRNMVSQETNLPATFDPQTGKNVRWSVPLGTETNSTPVITAGKVIIGTNHGQPRDPRHRGSRGVLLCLDEETGELCWQLVVPRLEDRKYLDWRPGGICSPATVEGDCVYLVNNRAEVMCLDLHGQKNGNDGPYQSEGRHMAPAGVAPMKVTEKDADILWIYDTKTELGVHPHDSAQSSILIDGPFLYMNTSNGVDRDHTHIPAPDAPSLIVLEKKTGRLIAHDGERIGPRVFHCTWSSPALGTVGQERRIFFGGPNGVCYGFKPLDWNQAGGPVKKLERLWRFDCDPTAPKKDVHRYMRNRRESPSTIIGMPVFYKDRLYVTCGGDIWWGKRYAWVKCIDVTQSGDVTDTGLIWSYPLERHCCCTPAIYNDLLFVVDHGRNIHCLDAGTGKPYWVQQTRTTTLSSPLVADGKLYVGTRSRLWVLAADRQQKLLASIDMDSDIVSTPVAANQTLYIATFGRLYAVSNAQ